MAGRTTGISSGPRVRRSPGESSGGGGESSAPDVVSLVHDIPESALSSAEFLLGSIPEPGNETDFYLRRSYLLVERLRRAVSDRPSLP